MSKTTDFILELESEGFSEYLEDVPALAPAPVMKICAKFVREYPVTRPELLVVSNWFPGPGHAFWDRNPLPF